MKLLISILTVLLLTEGCVSSKIVTGYRSANTKSTDIPVTITVLIETNTNEVTINDVAGAFQSIKPYKTFMVNYMTANRIEMRFEYEHNLTAAQKEELYSRISSLGGVRIMHISGSNFPY